MIRGAVRRNRPAYVVGIGVVVALGLASRRYADALPAFIARYAGDTLWAVMMFGLIGLLASSWPTTRVALATLVVSYGVEVSQLFHAPWLDAIRHTRLGGLVLGYGFLWSDLVCYTVGVAVCVAIERTYLTARTFRASMIHIPRP